MLPFTYADVVRLSSGKKSLLFAKQNTGAAYSELHMAAGERAILWLSRELAQLRGALVLIDEVEAGLHPWVQQLLMLQLQQLALRNDLQIIVTSHSPVVLDSVPPNGRIFLERGEDGQVTLSPPYRDIIQNALYGRAHDTLNLLCEDDTAEGILNGILDKLIPSERIRRESIRVGRNAGADEFPMHAAAFRKFRLLENFVFVLDGDQRPSDVSRRIRESGGNTPVTILYLPSDQAPEVWVWRRLQQRPEVFAADLGIDSATLGQNIRSLDSLYSPAQDSDSAIAKEKLYNLAEAQDRTVPEICRLIARIEAGDRDSEI